MSAIENRARATPGTGDFVKALGTRRCSPAASATFVNLIVALLLVGIAIPAPGLAQAAAVAEAQPELDLTDGPYVDQYDDTGWRRRMVTPDGTLAEATIRDGKITIPAVGDLPLFSVALRPPPSIALSVEPLPEETPLFVLADTHGEYPILIALLNAQGIIDDKLAWSFGNGHLAVTGDMLDRGAHQLEILWLFYKLEAEARAAGGRVHIVLGNHEALVLRGDERYLNPRYSEVAKRLGVPAYSDLLGADTVLGGWLRSRPSVLKLGDNLLLHGGISPKLVASDLSQDAMNDIVRRYLDIPHTLKPAEASDDALVMGNDGPLWYRGYFPIRDQPPLATDAEVAAALVRFGVSRILVGHTIVDRVKPLYAGKVIAVQVYPHVDETSGLPILEGALRLTGEWYRVTAQGDRIPLHTERSPK